jgi:hypothetical protein
VRFPRKEKKKRRKKVELGVLIISKSELLKVLALCRDLKP